MKLNCSVCGDAFIEEVSGVYAKIARPLDGHLVKSTSHVRACSMDCLSRWARSQR